MHWYFELDSLISFGLLLALLSLLLVFVCSSKKDKAEKRVELLVIVAFLWLSLFVGGKSLNQIYDTSAEQIVITEVSEVTEMGKDRGESILWNFGYNRNTRLSFNVFEKEYSIYVPTHSCDELSAGDNVVLGVQNGLFGIKHCYIIFDEENNVAEKVPEKRTEGKYIITNIYRE